MRRSEIAVAVLIACSLAGCAGTRTPREAEPPTIATLANREIVVAADPGVTSNEQEALAAYRKFLEIAPNAPQRSEAMRRLGDLEMDVADNKLASGEGTGDPDYKAAIERYQTYLKTYPNDPGNDRVYYQLSRAYEQGGQLELALKTLDQLVARYPKTAYLEEAQFRRGELLFSTQNYAKAEQAYGVVLAGNAGAYRERALYMQGWSQFKQGRLEDGLGSFFGVLDLKVAGPDTSDLENLPGLTRGDRELVEDTFRVTSISLANLQGVESVPAYIKDDTRRSYEFRVYQQLGDLYIKQDRTKDAADAYAAFGRKEPMHAQAPVLQARVIDIYQGAGFSELALDAKKDYVNRYGKDSEFRQKNPQGWEAAQPLVKTHLAELTRHHHALAQKSKLSSDYQEAVRWYRLYLASFPNDPDAAQTNFLLAELLREDSRFPEAAVEYEKVAYEYPAHAKSADAGYSALLSYAAQEKKTPAAELPALQRTSVDSALRFAKAFPADPRNGSVLTNAAEKLFALKDTERAAEIAQQVLALEPPAPAAQRRIAWTVIAHNSFEKGSFDKAERAYGEVLALTPEKDAARGELVERQAASIYKQGEQARDAGHLRDAVGHFNRVATVAPASAIRATAQYDAAAALIALKDWDGAARSLEDFRTRYPKHPLQAEVGGKLATAYLERGQWDKAAGEFERLAASPDPKVARTALWQSAELYEKAAEKGTVTRAQAVKAYERYLARFPQPLDTAMEARFRLAKFAKADGNTKREFALLKEINQADLTAGGARTDRTRFLGATAALAMAAPAVDAYKDVKLVEPLARQLKLKKTKFEEALKAYGVAANYGVADVTTAATFHTAALYQDFGKSLMSSQRPKKLSKLELEQYNVMLEEQAYPFEEKAIELHEVNAQRSSQGIYDEWVKRSFGALKELRPVRYGKTERSEGIVDAIR
jgi:tetratricopeptide (TPR) repeat protein